MVKKAVQKKVVKKNDGKKIVTVNCNARLGGEALFIEYLGNTYLTSQKLVNKLITGQLKKQDGGESKHINMGILDEEKGILKSKDTWLTRKENAIYFSPSKDEVLIASVDGFKKLMSGEWNILKLGKFTS